MKTVTILSLLSNDIENRVDELSTLGVVTFGPVVAGAGLSKDEVIGAENLAKGARSDAVHGAGLKVHKDGAGDEPPTTCLVEVDVDSLELEIAVAAVPAGRVDAVLGADHLPELGPDLVAALATLNVKDFTHFRRVRERGERLGFVEDEKERFGVFERGTEGGNGASGDEDG